MGERVRLLRERRGWLKADLARRADVSEAYVGRLEKDFYQSPGSEVLKKIAGALGVTADELTGERTGPPQPERFGGVLVLPVVQHITVSAGQGSWIETGDSIGVPLDLEKGHQLVALRVTGTCMAPEIEPGDTVVFDRGRREPLDGEMVVCTAGDGQLLLKRFYRLPGGSVMLKSLDGQKLLPAECVIEGVVMMVNKMVKREPF